MASDDDLSLYFTPEEVPCAELKSGAFESLSEKERQYAHHIAKASWEGAKICLLQTSPESAALLCLFQRVFAGGVAPVRAAAAAAGVSDDDFRAFVNYAAVVYGNLGNYKSFGDSKIVPRCPRGAFEAVLAAAPGVDDAYVAELNARGCFDRVYSLDAPARQLGVPPAGVSNYFTANVTADDLDVAKRFMAAQDIPPYNTRLFKDADGTLDIRRASAETGDCAPLTAAATEFEGRAIRVTRGDYAPLMARVVESLTAAADVAANDTQRDMLRLFADSFRTGDLQPHLAGSRLWVTDVGPSVESYIGFIETYQDPSGMRGEWEGFCAVVDKKTSLKFGELVSGAEALLSHMPWPPQFERDVFSKPDFTALDVLAFASSGVPAGINIPNYDEVRLASGFKNVSLSNVLSARSFKDRVSFLRDADQDDFKALLGPAFSVQVGLHELLGHGSGKLFMEAADGTLNFDKDAVVNPLTGAPVTSWYKPGTSYDSMFGAISSSMEECRAELTGLLLCVEADVLAIFGHSGAAAERIVYINWLNMVRAGLLALQFYTPGTKKWGQAHMMARYAILRELLEAGGGFVEIVNRAALTRATLADTTDGDDGVHVTLDASKIASVGIPAVRKLLLELQVFKATADVESATALYNRLTAVPDDWLVLRDLVIAKRKPRPLFVQPHMSLDAASGAVSIETFDESPEGLIQSFAQARYPTVDDALEALWREDKGGQ